MRPTTAISALALITSAGLLVAGPLSPPAGPIASTYKTLSEIEPRTPISAATTPGDASSVFKITQPGSYYLTGNITGVAGKTAIIVAASGVTLDLSGFSISGGQFGILSGGSVQGVTIRNGTITGCGSDGLNFSLVPDSLMENIRVAQCGGIGIVLGDTSTAIHCEARQTNMGFVGNRLAHFEQCTAFGCSTSGFYTMVDGATLIRCTSTANMVGFQISGSKNSLAESCIAQSNTDSGFICAFSTRLSGCTSSDNGAYGIWLNPRSIAERCVVTQNATIGISAPSDCTIRDNLVCNNAQQGIKITGAHCTIVANQVRSNGPGLAGIWITGDGSRAEDNDSTGQGFGLYVEGAGNFIARNSCSANTNQNFYVVPNNQLAPVVTNPALNGFATATPWSNFAF